MNLISWIRAYLATQECQSPELHATIAECLMYIQHDGSAFDIETSFFYIISLVDRWRTCHSEKFKSHSLITYFVFSACIYDKLTNDWPLGIEYFKDILGCSHSEMRQFEVNFLKAVKFDVRVSDTYISEVKMSMYQCINIGFKSN